MRAKLMRMGFSPSLIDEMDYWDQLDLLEIDRVEQHLSQEHQAKLIAVEWAKMMNRHR